jgi:hypothetical protein
MRLALEQRERCFEITEDNVEKKGEKRTHSLGGGSGQAVSTLPSTVTTSEAGIGSMLCRVLKRHASHNFRFIYQYRQYSPQSALYRPLSHVTQTPHSFTSRSPFAISKFPSSSPIFSSIYSIRFYGKTAVKRSVSLDGPPTNQEPDTHMAHGRSRDLNLTMSHAVRYQADLEPPFCSLAVKDAFEQVSILDLIEYTLI